MFNFRPVIALVAAINVLHAQAEMPNMRSSRDMHNSLPMEEPYEYTNFAYMSVVLRSTMADAFMYQQTGWQMIFEVEDKATKMSGAGYDLAKMYTKECNESGFCEKCAVVFAPADDNQDFRQTLNATKATFCGLSGVHGGIADELRGFYTGDFAGLVERLKPDRCGQVYSVGHSMGGALASLFAFCANLENDSDPKDKPRFAGLDPSVRLITVGAPVISVHPLYNGKPGNCFEGARFVVDDNSEAMPPASAAGFVQLLANVTELIGIPQEAADLSNAIPQLTQYAGVDNAASYEALLMTNLNLIIISKAAAAFNAMLAASTGVVFPNSEKIVKLISQFILDNLSMLGFQYDIIPLLQDLTAPLVHPRVQYVPLAHPKESGITKTWAGYTIIPGSGLGGNQTCDPFWITRPRQNEIKTMTAYLAAFIFRTGFANHQVCCYAESMGGPLAAQCARNLGALSSAFVCEDPLPAITLSKPQQL